MRTTIVLDDDVLDRSRALASRLGVPFRQVVNEALRAGLQQAEPLARVRPYRTEPHDMGLQAGRNLDNIAELLAQVEGEDHR
jgi:hypothetical protein